MNGRDDVAFEPFDFAGAAAGLDARSDNAPADEAAMAAYARGYEDGGAAAAAADAARTAAALDVIADALERTQAAHEAARDSLRRDAARLALTFARKLAGRLIERDPAAPVLEAFAALAFDLSGRADVAIALPPQALPGVEAALAGLAEERRAPPRLIADAGLPPGDCRILWPDGGLIQDRAALEARLETLLDRHFTAFAGPETTP